MTGELVLKFPGTQGRCIWMPISAPTVTAPPLVRWRPLLSNFGLAALFVVFVVSNGSAMLEHPRLSIALLVVFQATVVGLAAVRREARTADVSLLALSAAWAGTVLPLFLRPTPTGSDLLAGQILQVAGLVLQLVAVVSLGRSFGVVAADRGIKTGGAYRIVRHPIYAAYLLADLGFVVSHPAPGNIAAIALAAGAQVFRIWFEEHHLAGNPEYVAYCEVRRWRLVPGVW